MILIVFFALVIIVFFNEILPNFKKKKYKVFWVCTIIMLFALELQTFTFFGVMKTSLTVYIGRIINFFTGTMR